MENLLQGIVSGHKDTQKKLDEQTVVLNKILAIETKRAGVEKKELNEEKRQRRKTKRGSSDTGAKGLLGSLTKEAKKDKNGGFLGGLLSGGMGAIAKILGGSKLLIAGLAAAVGGAIALYVNNKQFKDTVDKIWKVTKDNILTPAWTWLKEKGPEAYKWLEKNILVPMLDFLRKGIPQLLKPLTGNDQANDIGDVVPSLVEDAVAEVFGAKRGKARKQLTTKKNNLFRNLQRSEEYGGFKEGAEREQGQEDFDETKRLLLMFEQKENMQVQLERIKSQLSKSDDEIGFFNHFGNPKGYRKRLEEQSKLIDQNLNDKVIQLKREKKALKDLGIDVAPEEFERKQKGGHINVPGQGSGDKVPMMLPGGSFVMNRNASMMLQQGGMVPTLLEPGEKVFGPGSWGPMEQMMNSTFGRFQEGGAVGDAAIWSNFLKTTTPKADPKAGTQPKNSEKETFKPGTQTTGPVAPGGHLDFIGDGSGFTGELRFIDAKGKTVGSYGGVSGTSRGAGSTQEQRKTISGQYLPLPDGSYPIQSPMGAGSAAVGSFAAWINNASGSIGNRSQLFLHNDIGSDGTAGCIGTELGGARGPNSATNEFTDLYNKVAPTKVNVGLGRNDGKKFTPGGGGGGGGGGGLGGMLQSALGGITGFAADIGKAFLDVFDDTGFFKEAFGGLFGGVSGAGGGNPLSGITESSEQLTGEMSDKAKEMVEYIKKKGYSTAQARGLVANAIRESSLNAKVMSGDDGGYGGLFQWKGDRQTAQVQELVKSGNWKGQIDYALKEDAGPRYLGETAGMNAHQAADWWDRKWERSADAAHSSMRHGQILQGFQTGGNVSNVRGTSNMSNVSMVSKSQDMFAAKIAEAVTPVVIPMPSGGGGTEVIQQPGNDTLIPDLPSADSSIMAMEYKYRITMGASV